jgi:Zn-dependent M28 family amino/carboxypeptidase
MIDAMFPVTSRSIAALLVTVLSGTAVLSAQRYVLPEPVRAAADAISPSQLAWDVARLASDEWQGRNTPSPGFDAAAAYIADRLAVAGVEPLGDRGGYRQHYDLVESRVDTTGTVLEVGGTRLRFGDDIVLRSVAAPIETSLPVVYVGHGWVIPARGIDPYAGLDVRGKILLAHGPRVLPAGVTVTQIGRVTVDARPPLAEAERLGAAGVLFITQASELIRWDAARNANIVRREIDPPVPSAYAAPGVTSLLLSPRAVDAILDGERVTGSAARVAEQTATFPASFELTKRVTVRVPLLSRTLHRPYNLVAMLRGSDPTLAGEYITVEAHLDGAVGSREVEGDAVYNSSDDNASGSAALLAIAERLAAAPRPKRSIIFIWDSGEEQGLWGTRQFVHAPPVALTQIAAHVNIDMIGASRRPGSADARSSGVTEPGEVFVIGPGVLSAGANALLEQVNADYLKLRFNRTHDRAESEFFYPRTDAGPFLERGILTIGFTTGIHDRYHLPRDEAQFLDPVQIHLIARTALASIWMLADASERPRIDRPIPQTVPRHK